VLINEISAACLASRLELASLFASVASKKALQSPDQWYSITSKELYQAAATTPLRRLVQSHSVAKLAQLALPTHQWKAWKFSTVPREWWSDINNQKAFLLDFAQTHQIKSATDWAQVHSQDLLANNGTWPWRLNVI